MMPLTKWKKVRIVLLLSAATAMVAHAQTFTVLADFDYSDGSLPNLVRLVQGVDGNLYGTTESGGAYGSGTVFRITPDGTVTEIYDFCSEENCSDGSNPSSITLGVDGNFFGTTIGLGTVSHSCTGADCGTIFKVTPSGQLTTLYTFSDGIDGESPYGGLIQATDGNFYGTTEFSRNGNQDNNGTVFRVTPQGHLTTLYTFGEGNPVGGVIQAVDGRLYGTTIGDGGDGCYGGCGTIFRITMAGVFETLHNFHYTDGATPVAGLIQGSDGNLYGTTSGGGGGSDQCYNGCGTAFRITPLGVLTTLHFFQGSSDPCGQARYCPDGADPVAPLMQATDGNFYGATAFGGAFGEGTIFQIMPSGSLVTLHSLSSDGTEGILPESGILQATTGILYGTAAYGGAPNCSSQGCGTVFTLNTGLGPFVAFVQAAGKVGHTAQILGQGFTGTTSVAFNGIPATFTVVSDTYITATVPAGAATGYVTVTTPSGTLTSNVPFHVLK
ncbi:MAG TPA: choice-of-anchor tandem repeat GloVer-containing protein [Terriglobales bacterium]|nr:choice-of-anchor tandem repeat GloVer-containing protein [Terriglobales bacterium]